RTEVSHVLNDANFQAMEDNDIERYVYTAVLDFKTSEICRDLDGKDFALKDKRQGINAPPMHPNCRSTTVPMVDDRGERLAKDKNGKYFYVPENMTYKEYAEKYLS
ncbi:minor capsid protein, partial [Phascolarctobacterium faecium]